MAGDTISEAAPAKLNLCLRVIGRGEDGYHQLDSLVGFTAYGDRLRARRAKSGARLACSGAFADNLPTDSDNLILRTHALLAAHWQDDLPVAFELQKNLPIAAGLGGGSSDAAAAARALMRLYGFGFADLPLMELNALGRDIVACLHASPLAMRGTGGDVTRLAPYPQADIVLVNPHCALATGDVFAAWRAEKPPNAVAAPPTTLAKFAAYLAGIGNDLTAAAQSLCSPIADVLAALRATAPLYAAMSGSGASCFALYDIGMGAPAAATLRAAHPDWWVQTTRWHA